MEKDLDVLELEARARALGEHIDALHGWTKALYSIQGLLFWLTMVAAVYDAFYGKSLWYVLGTFCTCYCMIVVSVEVLYRLGRKAADQMRRYVDRRQELFDESRRAR